MSRFLFMGAQEDQLVDTWVARGRDSDVRVYDGTQEPTEADRRLAKARGDDLAAMPWGFCPLSCRCPKGAAWARTCLFRDPHGHCGHIHGEAIR